MQNNYEEEWGEEGREKKEEEKGRKEEEKEKRGGQEVREEERREGEGRKWSAATILAKKECPRTSATALPNERRGGAEQTCWNRGLGPQIKKFWEIVSNVKKDIIFRWLFTSNFFCFCLSDWLLLMDANSAFFSIFLYHRSGQNSRQSGLYHPRHGVGRVVGKPPHCHRHPVRQRLVSQVLIVTGATPTSLSAESSCLSLS